MATPNWLRFMLDLPLGQDNQRRRHVLFVLATAQLYAVSVAVVAQSVSMGLLTNGDAQLIVGTCLGVFLLAYVLVRSGWSTRFRDPALTFPHALACQGIFVLAYVLQGSDRGNEMIMMGQTIVAAMLRLRPREILLLGMGSVALLVLAQGYLRLSDPASLPAPIAGLHLVVGGSTLLLLSLVGKWVSEIRTRIGKQARALEEALKTVQQMATTDMLTGLLNRREMQELLDKELKLVSRDGTPLTVALIDIDHFKQVNDRFGHQGGDAALRGLARHATTQIRQVDKLARWGGEEFLLMLPGVGHGEALVALERLRTSTETLRIEDQALLTLTLSVGLAQASEGESLDALVERADQALYKAKHAGRNRCQVAGSSTGRHPPPPSPPPGYCAEGKA